MADVTENEKAASEEQPVKISELPHFRSPQFVTVYANFAEAGSTPWDIRLTFSEVGEAEPNLGGIIERVTIILPPQVAGALVGVLQQNLKIYAEHIREITAEAQKKREADAEQPQGEAEAKSK
jgi:hypothetical protein